MSGVSARAADPPPPPSQAAYDRGVAFAQQKRYDEAARAFAEAYAAEPRVEALFAWAQVERLGGRCDKAIELYRRFLASPLLPEQTQAGEIGLRRCASVTPVASRPQPAAVAEAPAPARGFDWVAGSLFAAGALGVGAGATFLALSASEDAAAGRAVDFDDYQDHMEQARWQRAFGIGLGAAGVACAAGGLVRVLWRRDRDERNTTVVFVPSSRGATFGWRGRF